MAMSRSSMSMALLLRRSVAAVRPRCLPILARCASQLATAGGKDNATDLASVISRELDYEKEEGTAAADLKELAAALTANFKLVDKTGSARFYLERKVRGLHVRVDMDCSPMPSDEEEDAEDEQQGADAEEEVSEGYRMLVSVTDEAKGKQVQVGAFVVNYLRIHRVTLYDADKAPTADQVFGGADEIPVYAGPAFEELDDSLQNAFYEYVSELGIDDELAAKLADYCSAKEQLEYVNWLGGIQRFVK